MHKAALLERHEPSHPSLTPCRFYLGKGAYLPYMLPILFHHPVKGIRKLQYRRKRVFLVFQVDEQGKILEKIISLFQLFNIYLQVVSIEAYCLTPLLFMPELCNRIAVHIDYLHLKICSLS